MIRSLYSGPLTAALCVAALLVPSVARAQQDVVAPEAGENALPAILQPPIREFFSAKRIPPENPDAVFAQPGRERAQPGNPTEPMDSASPEAAGSAGSTAGVGGGQGRADEPALPDRYLDPSWPDIRPPLRAERRQQRLEADEAEREQANSGKAAAEEAAVPLSDADLYMKEEHEDTWDEDFKDSKGEPTDRWDPDYEDPVEW